MGPLPVNGWEAELMRKERELDLKAKELLKKQKILEKKVTEYKKKRNTKAKADLKAAKKLNRARKRLQLAVDARDKVEKHRSRKDKCAECEPPQCKWFDRINSILQKFHNYDRSCFCQRRPELYNICELYCKKIIRKTTTCPCEKVSSPCGTRSSPCHEPPCRPRGHRSLELDAGDCYEMAMRRTPNTWGYHPWPVFYPKRLDFRTQCHNLRLCMLLVASFLFWTPCLLCLLLCKCLCCSNCSD